MLVDCDSCRGRGVACAGCVIATLLDPPAPAGLTTAEHRAVEVLTRAGFEVEVLAAPPAPAPVPLAARPRRRRRHVA